MKVLGVSALLVGLTVAGLSLTGVPDAAATPLSAAVNAAPENTTAVEQVHRRRVDRDRHRYRHWPRYRYRTHAYPHYYGGWWYATPWWQGPSFSFGLGVPAYGNAHVQWCFNRFRSYDARTDSFLGYDGLRHRCRSPYRP